MGDWRIFLAVRLPLACLALAVVLEAGAWALRDTPPRRHDLDRLVLAIESVSLSADTVLLGDSVTQDVARTYRLLPSGRLANLTTNQASGLLGAYLLLARYMERNPAPRHVVVAATPEFFAYDPEGRAAETYLTSVFRRPAERAAIAEGLGSLADPGWRPAAFDLERRIVEPSVALAMPSAGGYLEGISDPASASELETTPTSDVAMAAIVARRARVPTLSPSARWTLGRLCALVAPHGTVVHVVRAPVPQSVLALRRADGAYAALDGTVVEAMAACPASRIADINEVALFSDHAMRDGDHLRRPGWSARYASLLSSYLAALN